MALAGGNLLPPNVVVTMAAPNHDPDSPISLNANEPLVLATPFLSWDDAPAVGGVLQVSLPTYRAFKAFGSRLSLSPNPLDITYARTIHIMVLKINAMAWGRILTEYITSGLITNLPANATLSNWYTTLGDLVISTPANLQLSIPDFSLGQPFTVPAANGIPRNSLLRVRFFSLTNVVDLQIPGSSPFDLIADLYGMVGACLSNLSRQSEISPLQLLANRIRQTSGETLDGSLAMSLISILTVNKLPLSLRPLILSPNTLREEARDRFLYRESVIARSSIEEKRLSILRTWYANSL